MTRHRVAVFVDGFNLYHAIHELKSSHLKWVDLWKLSEVFVSPPQKLVAVYYFSAYATWLPGPLDRHQRYVRALKARGVTAVMGYFKEKERHCKLCGQDTPSHEEKESDVNAALWMLDQAYQGTYDRALLVSNDSDLVPPIRVLHQRFPDLPVRVIVPPLRRHSKQLAQIVGKKNLRSIKRIHIERSLLPEKVYDPGGKLVAKRPNSYAPPALKT